jgi:phosphoribosylaminoimidazole-succinocarboxamide synthase
MEGKDIWYMSLLCTYRGKVRDIYELFHDHLLMIATDRVSAFDKYIGMIPGKGILLNRMSEFWFKNTRHIIDNHLVETYEDKASVRKCTPIKIEIIVRGYITGSTKTSLWTHYNNGERLYCGITFPDGLIKNQKLDNPVITPTTKGDVDVPISREEIVSEGYITEEDCSYIYEKALALFEFGQLVADKAGLILVDTKYEFGRTTDDKIILIDELHTCDSSRYWIKDSYSERFINKEEPEKLDKDCVRDWIISKVDPYTETIPSIPEERIKKAYESYKNFYDRISTVDVRGILYPSVVVILSGSFTDLDHVHKISGALSKNNSKLKIITEVCSAHRNTQKVLDLVKQYDSNGGKTVWITIAGKSNALSGVVAANSTNPVIACPPFADKMDMLVNINSTLQCPSGVPVMTILEPANVALAVERMFNM